MEDHHKRKTLELDGEAASQSQNKPVCTITLRERRPEPVVGRTVFRRSEPCATAEHDAGCLAGCVGGACDS